MRYTKCWSWLLLALLALGSNGIARAQDKKDALDGTWKLTVLLGGSELDLTLLKIETKGGVPKAEIIALNQQVFPPKLKVTKISTDNGRLFLTLKADSGRSLDVIGLGEDKDTKLMKAVVSVTGDMDFARLTRTDDTKIDPAKALRELPERAKFVKAAQSKEAGERAKLLKALVLDKATSDATVALAGTALIQDQAGQEKPDVKLIEEIFERILSVAKPYGPGMQGQQIGQILTRITRSDKLIDFAKKNAGRAEKLISQISDASTKRQSYSNVAIAFLRNKATTQQAVQFAKAAKATLGPKATVGEKVDATELLIEALKKAGDTEAVKKEEAELVGYDKELDAEFLKINVPFEVDKFKGRRGDSKRVAVVELFTGAQCPPCVAADVAFDALLKGYEKKDVVFLQYHLHIPGPDPLTCEEGDARSSYYEIRGTPTYFLNGGNAPQVGGSRSRAKSGYDNLRKAIDEALEAKAAATVDASAKRSEDSIEIKASASGIEKPGEKIRLRVLLVEDVVHYPGSNGQRFHHHVIRDLVGGAEGFAVTKKSTSETITVNLATLKKNLNKYLDEYGKVRPFPDSRRPMKLENLKVVAFVQNDETKEILNAIQVDVK